MVEDYLSLISNLSSWFLASKVSKSSGFKSAALMSFWLRVNVQGFSEAISIRIWVIKWESKLGQRCFKFSTTELKDSGSEGLECKRSYCEDFNRKWFI